MVSDPNAVCSSQACGAIERRSAMRGERLISIFRMASSVAVRAGYRSRIRTSRAAVANSGSPIVIGGGAVTGGRRWSARSRASRSPKSNGLMR